jgi:parvulin-like peptidyl-prolyl isomerase
MMRKQLTIRSITVAVLTVTLSMLAACDQVPAEPAADTAAAAQAATGKMPAEKPADAPEDTVAVVGDQAITFNLLNTMLNSSAMVGLSIPALGTPERNKVIITLLDKAISANLLYLDALAQGTDKKEPYTTDMAKYEDAVLAAMYQSQVLVGDIEISAQEVEDFYDNSIEKTVELTDDVRLAIRSKLRDQKLGQRRAGMRERLREGVEIKIDDSVLDSSQDDRRADTDVIATAGDSKITWGEVKTMMLGADQRASTDPFYIDSTEERMKRLQRHIDHAIMTEKARAAGMDSSEEFNARTAEYRKTHLINVHRAGLLASWQPSEDELRGYYLDNLEHIIAPESRKLQVVLLESKEEAEEVKAKVDSGEITLYQAAQEYSIDPDAKRTLGDIGWVSQGTGFKELDELAFSLEPEIVGGPVESPNGWHLVKVLDVLDGRYQNFDDPETQQRTRRRYLKEKLDDYVIELRKSRFDVAVFEDELTRQFQQEADYVAELQKKAAEQGSVTQERLKDLQKWLPPAQ